MKTLSKLKQHNIAWLAIGYGSFFLLVLWAAYTNNLPLDLLAKIPCYDKIGHVVLYATASYLGHRVLKQRHFRGIRWLPVFPVLFALAMTAEEIVQGLSIGRSWTKAPIRSRWPRLPVNCSRTQSCPPLPGLSGTGQ